MFSSSVKNYRLFVQFNFILNNKLSKIEVVLDTGAVGTIIPAPRIIGLKRSNFTGRVTSIGGFVESEERAIIYQIEAESLAIGDVYLPHRTFWTTFDSRVKDCVLGMDLLSCVNFGFNSDKQVLILKGIKPVLTQDVASILKLYLMCRNLYEQGLYDRSLYLLPQNIQMTQDEFYVFVAKLLSKL